MTDRPLVLLLVIGGVIAGGYLARSLAARRRALVIQSVRVDAAPLPRILTFYGPACDACDRQKAVLAEIERERPGSLTIELRDAAADYESARQFGLMVVPTTVVIDADGSIRGIHSGFTSRPVLEAQLDAA
jgi:thioredoxin-like negative regulator of GroEL